MLWYYLYNNNGCRHHRGSGKCTKMYPRSFSDLGERNGHRLIAKKNANFKWITPDLHNNTTAWSYLAPLMAESACSLDLICLTTYSYIYIHSIPASCKTRALISQACDFASHFAAAASDNWMTFYKWPSPISQHFKYDAELMPSSRVQLKGDEDFTWRSPRTLGVRWRFVAALLVKRLLQRSQQTK